MRVLSPAVRERSKKAEIKAQLKRERLEERSLRGRRKHAAQSHPDSTHRLSQGFGRMKVAIGFVVLCLATYFFSMAYADSESVPLVSEAGHTLVPGLETPPRTSYVAVRDFLQSISAAALAGPFGQGLSARFSSSDIRRYEHVVSWIFSGKPSKGVN
ncbi:hypothetical protein MPTK1_3g21950 [Marchantia polymorpha subsp. ruderalis]|uniref:Transmembrane protein n=2 Tax=Marchantia polymorpha TaxID=3197 RepID=A0AAF6B3E8_MARPO|nr:hypothetical protein MARPO_0089s0022 [Marchantia polymorpha]PTQ33388.1 hypothetical protein MARPO_0089s0022 [Marchantia polymorpha]BBN06531.1 hypothetical protein Mp_3g21950 [Marchantia polymorpha subsp. ruderalis]BBN06532.1 hypothetical protein Mp_3g21950 [Marchantia polymorpha subsp. ruderalis]|eukprot:PTQ33387.1 hypothetical protein MARPO_0089s0022 [Marchantia polymorpha]